MQTNRTMWNDKMVDVVGKMCPRYTKSGFFYDRTWNKSFCNTGLKRHAAAAATAAAAVAADDDDDGDHNQTGRSELTTPISLLLLRPTMFSDF